MPTACHDHHFEAAMFTASSGYLLFSPFFPPSHTRFLQALRLASNNIHSAGAQSLFKTITQNRKLKELDLGKNTIGRQGGMVFFFLLLDHGRPVPKRTRDSSLGRRNDSSAFLFKCIRYCSATRYHRGYASLVPRHSRLLRLLFFFVAVFFFSSSSPRPPPLRPPITCRIISGTLRRQGLPEGTGQQPRARDPEPRGQQHGRRGREAHLRRSYDKPDVLLAWALILTVLCRRAVSACCVGVLCRRDGCALGLGFV